MCSRPTSKPIQKIWYHFIRTRLIPITHMQTINKDRLVLLHCILEGKKIDVGRIIQREISACAFKQKGRLFFPTLISELCLRAGVEVNSNDEILPNMAAISTTTIKRFSHTTPKSPAGPAGTSSQQQEGLAANVAQLSQMVNHFLQQQQKVWDLLKQLTRGKKGCFSSISLRN